MIEVSKKTEQREQVSGRLAVIGKAENLTGHVFGHLTALYRTENKRGRTCWMCRCDCGREKAVTAQDLKAGKVKSCGCLKKENQKKIAGQLHRIDGTCIEILENKKYRRDNTSGFRGVFRLKSGRYRADIGFKGKRFYIGTFDKYEDAVAARLDAEKMIHEGFIEAYHKWKEMKEARRQEDPGWEERHPFVFEVRKENGSLGVYTTAGKR